MSTTVAGRASTVNVEVGGKEITLRDGQARQAGRRRRPRPLGRHDGAGDGPGPDGGARGRGLLPAHRRRRGADVRRRQDPGRLLQARGAPDRARDPDRAPDRPSDPAALAEGLQKRGAGHLHRPLGRHGHAARHPLHQRGVGRADDLAAALPRAGRRGARRRASRASSSSTRRCRRARTATST